MTQSSPPPWQQTPPPSWRQQPPQLAPEQQQSAGPAYQLEAAQQPIGHQQTPGLPHTSGYQHLPGHQHTPGHQQPPGNPQTPAFGPAPGYPAPPGSASGPTPAHRPAPSWLPPLLGLLVGAGMVLALALTGVIGGSSRPDTTPIALPASAHGLRLTTAVIAENGGQQTIARYDRGRQATIAQVAAAFGGTAVDVQSYSDAELRMFVTAQAIRAQTTGLTIDWVQNAADLGLAKPQQQIVTFGDVECLVIQQQLVPAGTDVDPGTEVAGICQRTADGLTIRVYGQQLSVQDSVALTNELWVAVGGH